MHAPNPRSSANQQNSLKHLVRSVEVINNVRSTYGAETTVSHLNIGEPQMEEPFESIGRRGAADCMLNSLM